MLNTKSKNAIEKLDMNDKINLLYLATIGEGQDATYSFNDIKDYLIYMKALADTKNISVINKGLKKSFDNLEKSPSFFKNYTAQVKSAAKVATLSEEEMLDLLTSIKKEDEGFALTPRQYDFLYATSNNDLWSFINSLTLPTLTRIRKNTPTHDYITKTINQDKMFSADYEIKGIYEPDFNRRNFDKKDGWKKIEGLHGTTNSSLLHILSGGFKTASQLRNENADFSYAGSMYGDAIYFALKSQASKPIWYMDHNENTTYIIFADLYYKEKVDADDRGGNFKYNGKNMVHAHAVGRYGRDELMVLPQQIDIRYVLEVGKK